jgi:hypothetical protein
MRKARIFRNCLKIDFDRSCRNTLPTKKYRPGDVGVLTFFLPGDVGVLTFSGRCGCPDFYRPGDVGVLTFTDFY